jgi:alpha-2-macroglobulin
MKINFFKERKNIIISLVVLACLITGFFVYYYFFFDKFSKIEYVEAYRLVPEKVSQSGLISIMLPPGVSESFAKNNIQFEPEIKGQWKKETTETSFFLNSVFAAEDEFVIIYFQPNEKLKLNHYYDVVLTTEKDEILKADFQAVDNPEILAIFPKEHSESSEFSEITIAFNRPMVPLTTLTENETKEIPVEIMPKTEGKWKWITTRNLQFTPTERLQRSSNYTVSVKSGMVSMDNVSLKGKIINFTTRRLRLNTITEGTIGFNKPIEIIFNQPVDLNKTVQHIEVYNKTTGKKVPFIAEYKEGKETLKSSSETGFQNILNTFSSLSSVFDIFPSFKEKKQQEEENKSVILVYNNTDRFGRKKIWDFEEKYEIKINKAHPLEGDINYSSIAISEITIAPFIKTIQSLSERTSQTDISFFDPEGKILVRFEEEIDLKKSSITAPYLEKIEYGEKCKEPEEGITSQNICEKVTNHQEIYLFFNSSQIKKNQSIPITFEKIVTLEGFKAIQEPIVKTAVSYPELKLLSTTPTVHEKNASVREIIFCTNAPLISPVAEDLKDYISADKDFEIWPWYNSRRITRNDDHCNVGEFLTDIYYGLMPLEEYNFKFLLKDVFGQKIETSLSFITEEMPSDEVYIFSYQDKYSVAPSGKTSFLYGARNIEYVNLNICKTSGNNFLNYLNNDIETRASFLSLSGCLERISVDIPLPKRYWIQNHFKIDVADYFDESLGYYIVTISHPNYKSEFYNSATKSYEERKRYHHSFLNVTNLGVVEKKIDPRSGLLQQHKENLENLYWVNNVNDLSSVQGAVVSLRQGESLVPVGQFFTNEQGIVKTPVMSDIKGVMISHGKDSTILPSWESRLNYASSADSAEKIYLYTDKPIYQPSQKVFIKGIHRIGYDGSYEIMKGKELELTVHDSRDNQTFSEKVIISSFGTFETSFILDKAAPLGTYRICLSYNCNWIDVQEYVGAPFEVKVSSEKEEHISKDKVKIEILADYYFGVPLEYGKVSYTLSSQNYFFDKYKDSYFNFGFYNYFDYPFSYEDKFLLRGETELSGGKAEIIQEIDLNLLKETGSRIIIADVTVQNPEGESVSSQFSFIVHAGERYLGISADKSFLSKNEPTLIKVKSVDIEGKEVEQKNILMKILKIEWHYLKRQAATGGFSYKWEKTETEINKFNFETDKNGNYQREIKINEEGEYLVEVSLKDKKENLVSSSQTIYVYGEKSVNFQFKEGTELDLEVLRKDLNIGDTGEIIIKSPYNKARALITIERGKIFEYYIKEIEGNIAKFTFPIKEEYAPNVFVSVLLQSKDPEVRFATEEFNINSEQYDLDIEIIPRKEVYLPGEKAEIDIKVVDYKGQPVEAELSLSVVDLSILALKGNPKKVPLAFFYSGFPLSVLTSSNVKNILIERPVPTKGGAGAMEAETRARGDFRELAFWQGTIITDKNGKAFISFNLPDNLTRWQAEAVGITKDTKIGAGYSEFTARKELMVVPLRPRFVVPGDVMMVGARVFNQTDKNQKINLSFKSETLELIDKNNQTITVKKDKTETFYFKVKANESKKQGFHEFIISGKGDNHEDTVIQNIPITPSNVYEITATSYSSINNEAREYIFLPGNIIKDEGELTVSYSATLAVFLSDALNYLLEFPYGCSEQISSQLNALAIIKKGLNVPFTEDYFQLKPIIYEEKEISSDEFIEIGLSKLSTFQNFDGGFAMWPNGGSNYYATLYVIEALNNLKQAGYKINEKSLEEAADFVFKEVTRNETVWQNNNNVIMAAYHLLAVPKYKNNGILISIILRFIRTESIIEKDISNVSLGQLAVIAARDLPKETKDFVFTIADNRLNIDSRGAFLGLNKNFSWYNFETYSKNTSLYLKAISISKKDHPFSDEIIRWLINSRAKDGGWGTTNDTLATIDAFVEYLSWKKETESNFTLNLSINNSEKDKFVFSGKTIFEQKRKVLSISDLKINSINNLVFSKENHNKMDNRFFYDLVLKYFLPLEQAPPRDEGFSIIRNYYSLDDKENNESIKKAKRGEVLRVNLKIVVPVMRRHVAIEDFIPAGFEIVNLDLATEQKSLRLQEREVENRELQANHKEIRNDRCFLYLEELSPGIYEFDYFVRALVPGNFSHLPAKVFEMYFPENFGRSSAGYFEISL